MEIAGNTLTHTVGQIGGTDPFPFSAMGIVTDNRHRQMHLLRMSLDTGSDGVQTGRHGTQQTNQVLGRDSLLRKLQK